MLQKIQFNVGAAMNGGQRGEKIPLASGIAPSAGFGGGFGGHIKAGGSCFKI